MRIFRRRKQPLSSRQEQVAGKIAGRILLMQRRTADYLNAKASGLSGQTLVAILVVFCLLFGGYCVHLLVQGFN